MSSIYASYTAPSPSSLYSADYFSNLTFRDAAVLHYPIIAKKGAMTQWLFDYNEHDDPQTTNIVDDEVILHIDDIQLICGEMEQAFKDGFRSVVIVCTVEGLGVTRRYHMSKVCHRLHWWFNFFIAF